MAEPGQPPTSFAAPNWLRIALVVVAAFQTLGSLQYLPVLFSDDSTVSGTTPGGLLITAVIVLSPIVAVSGFVFALKGQIRRAIMAIAGVSLLDWISYFPTFANHWDASLLEFPGPFVFFVLPACAPVALFLAWRWQWPKLAIALGLAPWVFRAAMVIVFGISVAIYGF
jgi:hypothetical protein